jgi:hypothetical protein
MSPKPVPSSGTSHGNGSGTPRFAGSLPLRCRSPDRGVPPDKGGALRYQIRQQKQLICRDFKPSDGLEPSTPSLPCAPEPLPAVATGCGSPRLTRFRGFAIYDWLPLVAPAWLHKCSMPWRAIAYVEGVFWDRPKSVLCSANFSTSSVRNVATRPKAATLVNAAAATVTTAARVVFASVHFDAAPR